MWLLVYGAAAPNIDHDMLRINTGIVIDECYTMCDGVHKYSLIHLVKKERKLTMQRAMKALREKQNVIQANLFDEQSIIGKIKDDDSTENLSNSTTFKWFIQCMNEKGLHVDEWVKPGKSRSLLQQLKNSKRATVPNLDTLEKEEIIRKFKALSAEAKSLETRLSCSIKQCTNCMQEIEYRKVVSHGLEKQCERLEGQLANAHMQIAEMQAKLKE